MWVDPNVDAAPFQLSSPLPDTDQWHSGAVLLMACSGGPVVAVQSGQIQAGILAVGHPVAKSLSGWDMLACQTGKVSMQNPI